MSLLAKNIENKLISVEEVRTTEDAMTKKPTIIPPIKSSTDLPTVSTSTKYGVKVQTPGTQFRQSLGVRANNSFYQGLPLKTSTADNDPNRRRENAVKMKCLRRLSSRVQGMVSPAMHRKLLSVDLSNLGMPDPEREKWGSSLSLTMSV